MKNNNNLKKILSKTSIQIGILVVFCLSMLLVEWTTLFTPEMRELVLSKFAAPSPTAIVEPSVIPSFEPTQAYQQSAAQTSNTIDCTGPDGKHLQVTQQECDQFNAAWKNPQNGNSQQPNIAPTSNSGGQTVTCVLSFGTYQLPQSQCDGAKAADAQNQTMTQNANQSQQQNQQMQQQSDANNQKLSDLESCENVASSNEQGDMTNAQSYCDQVSNCDAGRVAQAQQAAETKYQNAIASCHAQFGN